MNNISMFKKKICLKIILNILIANWAKLYKLLFK